MKLDKAIKMLESHNKWRNGDQIEMVTIKDLIIAEQSILEFFNNPHEQMVNFLIINTIGLSEADFKAYMEKMCEMKGIEYSVKKDIKK